jgi:two-component system phosphate regulon sensor histidine kinase PhoR
METLIKDLILLSNLDSLPSLPNQTPVELEPMLEMIREEVLAAQKNQCTISIECEPGLRLQGTADELYSAFSNLVMNAARYVDEQGDISICWYSDGTHARLAVRDNGIGIDAYHIPRLTERFYRVDSSRSIDTGGTGLGLAIVKHVLLRHQAELQIESQLGEGSTFSCIFPLR